MPSCNSAQFIGRESTPPVMNVRVIRKNVGDSLLKAAHVQILSFQNLITVGCITGPDRYHNWFSITLVGVKTSQLGYFRAMVQSQQTSIAAYTNNLNFLHKHTIGAQDSLFGNWKKDWLLWAAWDRNNNDCRKLDKHAESVHMLHKSDYGQVTMDGRYWMDYLPATLLIMKTTYVEKDTALHISFVLLVCCETRTYDCLDIV